MAKTSKCIQTHNMSPSEILRKSLSKDYDFQFDYDTDVGMAFSVKRNGFGEVGLAGVLHLIGHIPTLIMPEERDGESRLQYFTFKVN